MENIGNGEKEKGEKAEFPRISGVDSIHGIEDTYVRRPIILAARDSESGVKIEKANISPENTLTSR